MKKLVSIVLALALVLACCSVAFAADSYKITVENTNTRISLDGKTYNAYKIFDAVYGEGTAVSYTIKSDSFFYTDTDAKAALDVYFDFTPSANDATTIVVTVKKDPTDSTKEITVNARALADALTDHVPSTADGTATGTANSAEITVPAAGYYLVTGSVKSVKTGQEVETAVALVPVKDATAKTIPKADVPDLKKEITAVDSIDENLLDEDGKAAVAKVGSVVEYKLTSTVPDTTGYDDYTYTFTDTMDAGITYNDDAVLKIDGVEIDRDDYTYTKNTNGFTLTVPFAILTANDAGAPVTVEYSATVNASALTYNYEKNTANLEYSTNPGGSDTNHTPDQETYVIDINVDVNKYAVDPSTGAKLPGAEFKLFKGTTREGNVFYKYDNDVVTWVAEADADVFTTNDQGKLTQQIRGLDKGTYSLLETKAPAGYNLLAAPIEITISVVESADGKTVTYSSNPGTVSNEGKVDLSADHVAQPVDTIDVLNQQGTQLPSTGGIGTTIFYILGGVLVIGAAVILIARRKAQD